MKLNKIFNPIVKLTIQYLFMLAITITAMVLYIDTIWVVIVDSMLIGVYSTLYGVIIYLQVESDKEQKKLEQEQGGE